jgi:hypothetical protein
VTQPQILSQVELGWLYLCKAALFMYAHGQHKNVLKYSVNLKYGWGEQFEVAVGLNHDVMM